MPNVVKCNKCFKWQMTTAHKVFKCVSCQKSMPLYTLKIYFQSDSYQACSQVVRRLKEETFSMLEEFGEDDFFNYEISDN